MLAVMMEPPQETSIESSVGIPGAGGTNAHHTQEFLSTGRTGRRNALPDILSEHAVVSSGDLPARLSNLSTSDGASTSSAACSSTIVASTSKEADTS